MANSTMARFENIAGYMQKMHNLARCPVCFKRMRGDTVVCTMGHGVCGECREKVNQCPTCRSPFNPGGQPTLLRQLLQILPEKCPNDGCMKWVNIEEHKNWCDSRFINCRICDVPQKVTALENHCITKHPESFIQGHMIEVEIPLDFQVRTEVSSHHFLFKSGTELFGAMIHTPRNPNFNVKLYWIRREEMYERQGESYKFLITLLEEDGRVTSTTIILHLKKPNKNFTIRIPQAAVENIHTLTSKIVVNISISQRPTPANPLNEHQPDLIREPPPS